MGPPVGRARSPRASAPICRGPGDTLPQKTRGPPPRDLGGLSARSSAIFHIREPCALNTIGNIIGLAVIAGHRPLTRTREQEPMGRSRRTRTREPPGGAQPSPAQDSWPGSSRRERASWRMGGWRGRAHTHPGGSPWPGASRRSLKLIVRPAPPLPPEEETSPRVCLRQSGLLGRRTPEHSPPQSSSGGGANVDSRAPLIVLAGSPGSLPLPSTPPLPGWLQGAMGGPAVGEARRQPPAAIRSSSLGH